MKILAALLVILAMAGCRRDRVYVVANTAAFTDIFSDETEVDFESVVRYDDKTYYTREGHHGEGCQISRTEVEVIEGIPLMLLDGVTQSCTGKTCEHCGFKKGGGCECKNVLQGVCAHTITKNRDILRLE